MEDLEPAVKNCWNCCPPMAKLRMPPFEGRGKKTCLKNFSLKFKNKETELNRNTMFNLKLINHAFSILFPWKHDVNLVNCTKIHFNFGKLPAILFVSIFKSDLNSLYATYTHTHTYIWLPCICCISNAPCSMGLGAMMVWVAEQRLTMRDGGGAGAWTVICLLETNTHFVALQLGS